MKDIKSIFEGMFSSDIADVKGYEPIEIPDLDAKFRAWSLIREHVYATNNAIKEAMMLASAKKLKDALDEIEVEDLEEMIKLSRTSRGQGKQNMWYTIRQLKGFISKDLEVMDQEAFDNYNLWAGFAKAIKELFKDSLIKRYILSGDGWFEFENGEVYWSQMKKTTHDVDAVVKKVQKILPSNLVSIVQEENWPGPEIRFDSAALSNY